MPEVLSVPAKATSTAWLYQAPWSGTRLGAPLTLLGGVASRLTCNAAAAVERPAPFVQEPAKTWSIVSVVWNWSAEQLSMPLTESAPAVWMVTSLTYQSLLP